MDTSKFIILDVLENLSIEYTKRMPPNPQQENPFNNLVTRPQSQFVFGLRNCPQTNALNGVYYEIYSTDCLPGARQGCKDSIRWLSNCWISVDGLLLLTNDDEEELSNPNCVTLLCNKIIERYLNDKARA